MPLCQPLLPLAPVTLDKNDPIRIDDFQRIEIMTKKEIFSHKANVLRQRAEEKAVRMTENLEAMSVEEIQRILYELRVHQIELEMQNEHLQRAHVEIDVVRERYYALYDLAPIGYFTLSEHGLFLEANLAASTMLGLDRGTLIKQRISSFILEEDQNIYYFHHNRLFEAFSALGLGSVQTNPGQTGEPQACELRMLKNDGTSFWAHLTATVRQDSGAAPVSFIAMSDITERKLAEAKIQDALEYAENIVETVREPLLVLTPDLKILTANRSFYDTFKVTHEETVGNFIFNLGNRQWDIPGLRTLLEDILPHKNVFNGYEVEHNFPDIGFKTILLNARQIFRKDIGSQIILLAMEDITERKLAEKLQETNRQLEATTAQAEMANATKNTFLANMSHEIRTPLSGMLGMTGLLQETFLTEKQRDYADKIRTNGELLLAVLNDILDFSRMEAGKLHLEIVPFSLKEVISNVVNIFESQAAEKKIWINTTIDPELPAVLMGDPQRMTQVIANLVGNAVKFTDAGCIKLGVKVRRQTETDVELDISVQDTGIGMTEEELSRLFTAFSQADDSTTRRFGGTGLGLAISRKFVKLMGGTIRAESTPGKGSLFTVVLSFLISSGIGRTNLLRHLDTRRIQLPQEKCAADELYLLTKQKRKLGSAEELHPLLERLKLALASEEPVPCMKILEELSQRRWSESHETALAEVNRLVQQYRLAEALAFLNKEFDDVMKIKEERDGD